MSEFLSLKNAWLKVAPGVTLTERIDAVIVRLDEYFHTWGSQRIVTSGFRLKQDQVKLIIDYAKKKGIQLWDNARPEDGDLRAAGTYVWQMTWSKLLAAGVVINPPREAAVLKDYKKSNGVLVYAGTLLQPSAHMSGRAFDISGRQGDQEGSVAASVTDELEIIKDALKSDPDIGIASYVAERENNCLHVNVV